MMVGDDVDDDAVMVAAVQVMVAALDRLLQTRFLSLSVLCPFPMPRYLGVRAKIEKGRPIWVAEAYGAELGRAPSEDKAAEIVRNMGQAASIQSLSIPSTVLRPKSVARYVGVFHRKAGKKSGGGWWVGKKHFFKSLDDAIAYVCRQKGVTRQQLRRRVAPNELASRFRALTSTVDLMPNDLRDLVSRARHAKRMFTVAPVMVPLFLQAKLGPWRGLIQQAWTALAPTSSVHCPLDEDAEAKLAWKVLRKATLDMAQDRQLRAELEWWNKLNIGVQHHSGFLAMCVGMGVLETGGQLDLGSVDTKYRVAADTGAAVDKLKAMSLAWKSLSPVLCTPHTCEAWRRCMLDALDILRKKGAPRLNPKCGVYLPAWTLRCYLIMVTRENGIHRMAWGSIGIRALGQMCPDQKEWFGALEQHVKTVAALKGLLGTHCPPELLSCQLCLLSRKSLDDYDSAWLAANKRYIQAMAVVGQKLQNGVSMPVEVVLQQTAALLEGVADNKNDGNDDDEDDDDDDDDDDDYDDDDSEQQL